MGGGDHIGDYPKGVWSPAGGLGHSAFALKNQRQHTVLLAILCHAFKSTLPESARSNNALCVTLHSPYLQAMCDCCRGGYVLRRLVCRPEALAAQHRDSCRGDVPGRRLGVSLLGAQRAAPQLPHTTHPIAALVQELPAAA